MKVFIIEDEMPALANLKHIIKSNFDDLEIVGESNSVESSVAWLKSPKNEADLIFMDVELSDGVCFEIFKKVDVTAQIIITTAYDNHAIKAFKIHCVDYLLKPIDPQELIAAVERCRYATNHRGGADVLQRIESVADGELRAYKKRFVIKIGDRLQIIKVEDIAYFMSRDKTTYLINREGKSYIVDLSLDMVETLLDPGLFFRFSRACITNINSIKLISRHYSGRLKITLEPKVEEDLFVSRIRTNDFLRWINQ